MATAALHKQCAEMTVYMYFNQDFRCLILRNSVIDDLTVKT